MSRDEQWHVRLGTLRIFKGQLSAEFNRYLSKIRRRLMAEGQSASGFCMPFGGLCLMFQ